MKNTQLEAPSKQEREEIFARKNTRRMTAAELGLATARMSNKEHAGARTALPIVDDAEMVSEL